MNIRPPHKDTRFKPGQSGNPKGRPRLKITAADLRAKLANDLDLIIDSVVKAALQGDIQAARLVLERVIPAIKPSEQPVQVNMPTGATLTEQGRAVLASVAAGELAPTQGAALVAALGKLAQVAEVDELVRRVEALEGQHAGRAQRPME